MKLARMNAIVDLALLIMLVPTIISGAVTLWILPQGGLLFRGGLGSSDNALFLGLNRQEWRAVHDITGLIFLSSW